MASTISLSIFLLRKGREADYDREVGDDRASRVDLASLDGYFSPIPATLRAPKWVTAINGILPSSAALNLQSQSPAGLLLVRQGARTFVLTFGHAWMKLQTDWLERDFGRRVALNLIGENDLVEIRAEQVFARWHLASERAPRATSVDEFGVEFDRDLVAVVEGVSSDPIFGKIVRGGTSLRCVADLATLPSILDQCLLQFASTAYTKRWPDIDNLSPVTDLTTVAALEKQLDADLAAGRGPKRVVLSTPSQRNGEALTAASYVVGRLSRNPASTPYLTFAGWEGYARRSNIPISVDGARKTRVHLLDENAAETVECSAFDCFGYEANLSNKPHILSSGVWYEAVPTFVSKIDRSVTTLPAPVKKLLSWNGTDDEGAYNLGCAGQDASLLHFDKATVWYGGGQSKFEFCDLMHLPSKTLFFAKNPLDSQTKCNAAESQVARRCHGTAL